MEAHFPLNTNGTYSGMKKNVRKCLFRKHESKTNVSLMCFGLRFYADLELLDTSVVDMSGYRVRGCDFDSPVPPLSESGYDDLYGPSSSVILRYDNHM